MPLPTIAPPSRHAVLAACAEQHHGLLTAGDLRRAGVGPREIGRWVAAGRLANVAHGVYRVGGCPPSTEASILASVLVHGPHTWASHRTAGWLWRLDGFGRPGRIEVTRLTETSNQRSAAIVHRSTTVPFDHQARVGPIPVTSLPRTLFDLAGALGSLYRVTEELGGRGRRGTVAMRSALAQRGADYVPTESELDLLGRAVVASITGIEWQVELSDEQGYIRRVDGLHPAARLVLEWDGAKFHDTSHQRALDAAGDRRLAALGLLVVRYRWADVTARPGFVRREVALATGAGGTAARRASGS